MKIKKPRPRGEDNISVQYLSIDNALFSIIDFAELES